MDDHTIIALFFKRNEDAIRQVSEKYHAYIEKIIDNILHSHEDTEECLNDVWLAAWNSIPPTKPFSLKNYLSTIARNISINCYNKRNADKRKGSTEELLEEMTSAFPDEGSPDGELNAKELGKEINRFLEILEKDTRVCFVLRYYYCYSNEEIAMKTGKSPRAVASLLYKTRERLKNHLQQSGYLDPERSTVP